MSRLAIIDIGSTSVGGITLDCSKPAKKTKEFCGCLGATIREDVSFQEDIDLQRYLEGITGALKKVAHSLAVGSKGAPTEVVCFLSAPFYASQTQKIKKTAPKPFPVTRKLLEDLVAEEVGKFKKSKPTFFRELEGKNKDAHEIIESVLVKITLNGYDLPDYHHQLTEELTAHHYLSLASSSILDRFRASVASAWPNTTIQFHSFAYAFSQALLGVAEGKKNFLVLDIGGEISEVSLIWQEILLNTISFPLGRNWLVRKLAKTFATTPIEAYSSLKLYSLKTQTPAVTDKIDKLLVEAKEEWLKAFRGALERAVDNSLLPENVFALADPVVVDIFRGWLKDEQFENLTIGNKNFAVNILPEDIFGNFCSHGSINTHDFTLMVEAIFCDIIKKK